MSRFALAPDVYPYGGWRVKSLTCETFHSSTYFLPQSCPCFQNCAQGIASLPREGSHTHSQVPPLRSSPDRSPLPRNAAVSLLSSLTQKCERGLLNGPDRLRRRRPRGQQQKAGVDFAAAAEGNKSTYCTHSTKKERRKTSRGHKSPKRETKGEKR